MNCCKDGICDKGQFCQAKHVLDDDDIEPAGAPSPWMLFLRDCLYLVLALWIVAFSVGVMSGIMERV